MKNLFFTLLILLSFNTFCQIIDDLPKSETGRIVYSEIIPLDSLMKNQLYLNSKQFFVNAFKSANDVIQMDDKDAGIIVGKGFTDIYSKMLGSSYPVKMWYTIKIRSNDGRYKYEIYNIYFENYPPNYVLPNGSAKSQTAEDIFDEENYYRANGQPKNLSLSFKTQMAEKVNSLHSLIVNSMNKSSTNENKDNW